MGQKKKVKVLQLDLEEKHENQISFLIPVAYHAGLISIAEFLEKALDTARNTQTTEKEE